MLKRLPDLILLAAGLATLSFLVLKLGQLGTAYLTPSRVFIYYVLPGAVATLMFALLRLPRPVKANVSLTVATVGLCLFAAEIFLHFQARWGLEAWEARIERELGKPIDRRSRLQVVADLRRDGVDAAPAILPTKFGKLQDVGGTPTAVLSGVASATTVFCNEAGEYLTFLTDALGFRNPPGLWELGRAQVMIVGDSYAQGTCVEEAHSLAGQIRARYPRTLNVSFAATGPLFHLAVLSEYGTVARPQIVLWFYYANDLFDLERSRKNPIMMRYFEDGFRQRLFKRRAQVNAATRAFAEDVIRRFLNAEIDSRGWNVSPAPWQWRDFLTLSNVRRIMGLPWLHEGVLQVDFDLNHRVMERARDLVRSWGGEIHFVYLPSISELAGNAIVKRENT